MKAAALILHVVGVRHLGEAELGVSPSEESDYLSFAHVPNSTSTSAGWSTTVHVVTRSPSPPARSSSTSPTSTAPGQPAARSRARARRSTRRREGTHRPAGRRRQRQLDCSWTTAATHSASGDRASGAPSRAQDGSASARYLDLKSVGGVGRSAPGDVQDRPLGRTSAVHMSNTDSRWWCPTGRNPRAYRRDVQVLDPGDALPSLVQAAERRRFVGHRPRDNDQHTCHQHREQRHGEQPGRPAHGSRGQVGIVTPVDERRHGRNVRRLRRRCPAVQ